MTEIKLTGAVKQYGEGFKLGPLNLTISDQDTVAVMGKNGAGKTTLFQCLSANADLSEGTLTLNGDILRPESYGLKKRLGYLPQHMPLPDWVSAVEVLRYAANLYGQRLRKDELSSVLEYWDCVTFAHKPLAACSHGMQKRVGLAVASFHDPDVLILDEPFSGLDIYHIRALEQLLEKRAKAGRCTFISTHIAPYAAKFCNRAIFLSGGQCDEATQWRSQTPSERVAFIETFFFTGR